MTDNEFLAKTMQQLEESPLAWYERLANIRSLSNSHGAVRILLEQRERALQTDSRAIEPCRQTSTGCCTARTFLQPCTAAIARTAFTGTRKWSSRPGPNARIPWPRCPCARRSRRIGPGPARDRGTCPRRPHGICGSNQTLVRRERQRGMELAESLRRGSLGLFAFARVHARKAVLAYAGRTHC